MEYEEFAVIVEQTPEFQRVVRKTEKAIGIESRISAVEVAVAPIVYVLLRYVLVEIGLPWLHEASRYSDLWRMKFRKWVDEQYHDEGFDPVEIEKAGKTLRHELEQVVNDDVKRIWEDLARRIRS